MKSAALRVAGAVLLIAVPSAAAGNTSVYTEFDLTRCRTAALPPDLSNQARAWRCEGYKGIVVHVVENAFRMSISYGEAALSEPAASQTLPVANRPGRLIEWRLDPAGTPFATIFRLHTNEDGRRGSTLVITRLGPPGQVCHVGYVDAVANPDANELARKVADRAAVRFLCGEERALEYGLSGDEVPERY